LIPAACFPQSPCNCRIPGAGCSLYSYLEAAVPPATNLAIATKAFGSEEQLHYAGTGLILTYLASAAGIPLFVILALLI
jgi:hypothetical protein